MQNAISEIILYPKEGSRLEYKNGTFQSLEGQATALNEILKKFNYTAKQIGSKKTEASQNKLPISFQILVGQEYAKEMCEQLNALSIIDGAYIKPNAEEPDIGF